MAWRRKKLVGWIVRVMATVALLGVAYVLMPSFNSGNHNARHHAAMYDLANCKTALENFKDKNGRYPTTAEGLKVFVGQQDLWHLSLFLKDPWDRLYIYRSPGRNGSDYDLYSTGPSGVYGAADNVH